MLCRFKSGHQHHFADMAQSAEHFLGKEEVTGSIPVISSTLFGFLCASLAERGVFLFCRSFDIIAQIFVKFL